MLSCTTNQWTGVHQTLVADVVETTDEPVRLIRFSRSKGQGQGHSKVRCGSELEVSISRLGRPSIIYLVF